MAPERDAPSPVDYRDWKQKNALTRKGEALLARAKRLAQRIDERVRELTEGEKRYVERPDESVVRVDNAGSPSRPSP
jgi:hypothetical protein